MRYDGTLITIQLLRYCYCMMLSNTASTNPTHSLGSQPPTATKGELVFLLEQLVAESNYNQYASTTARGQLACICNPTTTTKTQSLRLIDLHARGWRSWRREIERVGERERKRLWATECLWRKVPRCLGPKRRTLREGDECRSEGADRRWISVGGHQRSQQSGGCVEVESRKEVELQ